MAKKIRTSTDAGVTWNTLPGQEGELSIEANAIEDTIFGQDYGSSESGLATWEVSANAYFKGFAGYIGTIKRVSTAAATMTNEPCALVSGKTYQITNAAKRQIDHATAVSVRDNAVVVAASNILNIDYLFGRVTFVSGYTVVGAVTITGKSLTLTEVAKYKSISLTQSADAIDLTDNPTARANGGYTVQGQGLKTVSCEIGGIFSTTNDFIDLVAGRTTFLVEINPDGAGMSVARGFFKPASQSQSGAVGDLEEETLTLNLSVPAIDLMKAPFGWMHTATTLSTAVVDSLAAWESGNTIKVQYLPDGVIAGGKQGDTIVTEASLEFATEGMNTFSFTYAGTGSIVDAT